MRRKNLHPRYRKKCVRRIKDEKILLLNKKKEEIKFNKFKSLIYSLPLDVKCLIFQMAVSTLIINWKNNLRPVFWPVITEYHDSNKGLTYISTDGNYEPFTRLTNVTEWRELDTFNIRKNLPCVKNVKKNQDGIISVYIPPEIVNDSSLIKNRHWSNMENRYWTHQSCRCYCCDLVRVLSGKNLDSSYSAATGVSRDIRLKHKKRYISHTYRKITMNQLNPSPWKYNN